MATSMVSFAGRLAMSSRGYVTAPVVVEDSLRTVRISR